MTHLATSRAEDMLTNREGRRIVVAEVDAAAILFGICDLERRACEFSTA